MEHDELLDKVELTLGTYISRYYGSKKDVELRSDVIDSLQALRAVVELHKPRVYKKYQSEEIAYIECTECKEGEPIQGSYYPCDTIQAIQGQLSTEIPTE